MNRATILQAAVLAIVVGALLILAGAAPEPAPPAPVRSWRPATPEEERQRERERLEEELDRIWRERTSPAPSASR